LAAGRITQPVGPRFDAQVFYLKKPFFQNGFLEWATTNFKSIKTTSPAMGGASIYTNEFLGKVKECIAFHCCHLQVPL
jgi:hypothetical protein